MKIGNWEVTTVETGMFALDGGAMFGVVPKTLWSKATPADEKNRIQLAARNMLLRSEKRTILVDNGNGDKWSDKLREIYSIGEYTLEHSLAAQGVKVEDITDVVLTHLHFDHAGGSTKTVNGKIVPRFPNATYHVQKDNLKWAQNATEKDRASYLKENFEPLLAEGVLKTIDGEGNFGDGVELIVLNGHTAAQELVKVSDGKSTAVFCGDLIPTSAHIHVPYVMAYDNFPITTLEEKKKYISRAYEEGWMLVFEHDPNMPAATVTANEKGFAIKDKIRF
jgi:glyoxylase-like metal-dependent hydrolase (beta-lactamase superfamily II)